MSTLLILIFSLVVQFVAAFLCLYHYLYGLRYTGWLVMTVAFFGFMIRRAVILWSFTIDGIIPLSSSEIIASINSVMLLIGVLFLILSERKMDKTLKQINEEIRKKIKEYE